ncbi:MAG: glycosyltransferase family 4 protein [Lachnospiraceae bacterium]|nr:glycosyltransferase family 4 protein [Lachnospiraceae bacterium]
MKVLSVIWKISDDKLHGFSDDKTGLIVVRDLCEYLGRKVESYLLLGKEYLPKTDLGNIHIVDTESVAEESAGKSRLEILAAAFEKALIEIRPDIVHVHDSGDFCRACMRICCRKRIPYIFTAHSFIGKDQKISVVEDRDILWQEEVYTMPDIHVVSVSKGIMPKLTRDFPHLKPAQLCVIQNGTTFRFERIETDLKEKLGFQGKKLLICPGKITDRKNQMQVVRAFRILPKSVREKIGVLFCGNDRLEGRLQRAIKEAGLEDSLKYVGVLDSVQMKEYYSVSDGLIMPSRLEGLSIAALEALACGLPVIMFSDIECAMDLDDENAICLVKERTDEMLAEAVGNWALRDWDREAILQYSARFTMERVAEEYIEYYRRVLNEAGNGKK